MHPYDWMYGRRAVGFLYIENHELIDLTCSGRSCAKAVTRQAFLRSAAHDPSQQALLLSIDSI